MTDTPRLILGLIENLEGLGIPYLIGGSFASSAWGQPRQTNDLDIAVLLDPALATSLYAAVREEFMASEDEMVAMAHSKEPFRSFQLLHFEETFKIDVFVLHPGAYAEASLARVRQYELAPGRPVAFASPEDVILTKLRCFVLGNRVSDRQWNDVVQVLEVQAGELDEGYMSKWAAQFGVLDLLRQAQSQALT